MELTEPQSEVMGPPRRQSRPSLLGTDAGEGRPAPPPRTRDVPWSPGEGPSGEHPVVENAAAAPAPEEAAHAEDAEKAPELPASAEEKKPVEAAPSERLWSFAPTPGQFTKEETAEPGGGGDAAAAASPAPDWEMPVPLPPPAPAAEPFSRKDDFSFASLTEDPARQGGALPAETGSTEESATPAAPFPGDEPTRVEPVSAALLEKLRERDDEGQATRVEAVSAALLDKLRERDDESGAAAAATPEPATAEVPPAEASAPAEPAMQDLAPAPAEEPDPDEPHWRETFDRFRQLKAQLGEPVDRITFEQFAAKLRKNRADLVVKHRCKGVRFSVYEKDGRAAIKASAIR